MRELPGANAAYSDFGDFQQVTLEAIARDSCLLRACIRAPVRLRAAPNLSGRHGVRLMRGPGHWSPAAGRGS